MTAKLRPTRVSMVTGASSGIGRAIAIQMAIDGSDVIAQCRAKSEKIESVVSEIQSLGRSCDVVYGDFSESDFDHASFVDSVFSVHGQVDHWVNNAGGDVLTGELSNWDFARKLDYLWRVDVLATLHFSKIVGARMAEQVDSTKQPTGQYSIINIGWDQANQGMAGDSGEMFATTKGAIMSMSLSLAQSLAPHVRVNCVAPGWIQTSWGEQTSEFWDYRAKHETLMNRWGTPDDVAQAVVYLCKTTFVSGQILPINGGFRFSNSRGKEN